MIRLLVINPNSSESVTQALKTSLARFTFEDTSITYWTNPRGPSLLKNEQDLADSAGQCLPLILDIAVQYDGFLIACYAAHPLTDLLREKTGKPVTGIFESSITTALHARYHGSKFGILTTVAAFVENLNDGVSRFLDGPLPAIFAGVVATGITAEDLTDGSRSIARSKIINATRELVAKGDVKVICMGGVILSGMETWVREACALELGIASAQHIEVIDQMLAGVSTIQALTRILQSEEQNIN